MRARRMGTDSPFIEVDKVQLKDSDILFKAEVMEFQMEDNFDYLSTNIKTNANPKEENRWQGVRERAAIAAMQGTMTILGSSDRGAFREIVVEGYSGKEKTYPKEIAEFAVACADALVEKLKNK